MGVGGSKNKNWKKKMDERTDEKAKNVDRILTRFRAASPIHVYQGSTLLMKWPFLHHPLIATHPPTLPVLKPEES